VSIVIPAFNEESTVGEVVVRTVRVLRETRLPEWEVLVIDDGSTDRTGEIGDLLCSKCERVRVIHHRTRSGLTEALKTGFKNARYNLIVFLPADLEYYPEEAIPALLSGLDNGLDVVCAWRKGCRRSFSRSVPSAIYCALVRKLFGTKVHHPNAAKAIKRAVALNLPLRSGWHRYIIPIAYKMGYRVGEVPVHVHPRDPRLSKFGARRLLEGVADLWAVFLYLHYGERIAKFIRLVALLLLLLAIVLSLYTGYSAITGSIGLGRALVLFSGIALTVSLSLFLYVVAARTVPTSERDQ